ncbi:tetratricopeptide repeat protein [Cupriavidus sp. 2TAF22]|uniref:tetratricopeptide repeat protein n=1 Tax=unclassified Cupriavidus TaxID=2640874 RepID=UPI003F917ECB
MAKYKCPTLGDCERANAGEIFERSPGDDLHCPGCNILLDQVQGPTGGKRGGVNKAAIAGAAAVVVALAGGGYFFLAHKAGQPEESVEPVAAPVAAAEAAPEPAPASAPASAGGIAPNEAETAALRTKGESDLKTGNADSAEQASNKAAANEMLKLAIAKMTQGKLDEAEKSLASARDLDPRQSLVPYNLAVLRLKQGRTDDALKEFEASFMAGFPYFDKMDQDPDLDSLRKDPRFTKLVEQYRKQTT